MRSKILVSFTSAWLLLGSAAVRAEASGGARRQSQMTLSVAHWLACSGRNETRGSASGTTLACSGHGAPHLNPAGEAGSIGYPRPR